ncbi:MAG: hypothetical protein RLZZ08_1213 [Pseudomonadota bacterium]
MSMIEPGSVWLVGAGPGDPDLLTRKAERLLQAASVVFHDALVGAGVLALIPPHVATVSVGKRSGRHSKDQASISQMIVDAALAGEKVVRLKGGDPAIFGRMTEELASCRAACVPVRICPGVTAASAAAASLGLSLTQRGQARRLVFVTAHTKDGHVADEDWQALADPQASLAIYMGKASSAGLARSLIGHGLAGDTPVALVENASLPDERIIATRLDLLSIAAKALGNGPALIIVGAAAADSGRDSAGISHSCKNPREIRASGGPVAAFRPG